MLINAFPLVGRELRHASRQRLGFYVRIAAALLGATFGAFYLLGSEPNGRNLFIQISYIAFFATISSGVFLTSDSLRSEKREGTLGLLFLTRLRGIDIVLGKLASNGTNALMALVALMPVFALSLLLGGVSGSELARVSATLLSALVLSLSVGLAVSASGESQGQAVLATGAWLLIPIAAWHSLASAAALRYGNTSLPADFFASNPWNCLVGAVSVSTNAQPRPFWIHTSGTFIVSCAILAFTAWRLPHQSTDCFSDGTNREDLWRTYFRKVLPKRPAFDRAIVDRSPIAALISSATTSRTVAWLAASAGVFATADARFSFTNRLLSSDPDGFAFFVNIGALLTITTAVAWESCVFFQEARGSGWLELLATTPLRTTEFLDGQWRGLRRIFMYPCLVLSASLWVVAWKLNTLGLVAFVHGDAFLNLVAASRAGVWFGLHNGQRGRAFLKTVAVIALPKLYWMCMFAEPIYLIAIILEAHARFRPGARWLAGGVTRSEFKAEAARMRQLRLSEVIQPHDRMSQP